MKRYWFTILLALLIVAGAGSYYVQAEVNGLPEFVLQRQSGDAQAAAGVILEGFYDTRDLRETVAIDAAGTEFRRDMSLVEKLMPDWGTELNQLIERQPQFMRGKRNITALYEDENRLVYADVDSESGDARRGFRFKVSVLDKKREQTAAYEAAVPNGRLYQHISVSDVQVVGEQIKVLTVNYLKNREEPHLYTLGMQSGSEPADQALSFEPSNGADVVTVLQRGYKPKPAGPSRYAVLHAVTTKRVQETNGGYQEQVIGRRLLIYDIQSGQEVKKVSKEINDFLADGQNAPFQIIHEGETVHLAKQTKQGVKMIQYHITEGKTVERFVPSAANLSTMRLKDDYVYMLTGNGEEVQESPTLVISDITTGNPVYKGKIVLKEANRDSAEAFKHLIIHGIDLK